MTVVASVGVVVTCHKSHRACLLAFPPLLPLVIREDSLDCQWRFGDAGVQSNFVCSSASSEPTTKRGKGRKGVDFVMVLFLH